MLKMETKLTKIILELTEEEKALLSFLVNDGLVYIPTDVFQDVIKGKITWLSNKVEKALSEGG